MARKARPRADASTARPAGANALRALAVLCACAALVACGGDASRTTPTAPSRPPAPTQPLGLLPGPYVLLLMRYDFSGTPLREICSPPGVLRGALHQIHGQLRAEGAEWVYVGGDAAGAPLVFRFRVSSVEGNAQVSGALRGGGVDAGGGSALFPPSGNRVEIEDGSFTGQWSIGPGLLGTVTGTLAFSHPDGTRMTCTEARLQMAPGPPPGT